MNEHLVGITELRDRASDLFDEVEERDLLVLRRNRPIAHIIHPDRLNQVLDRIEDLEDMLSVLGHKYGFDPDELRWEPIEEDT